MPSWYDLVGLGAHLNNSTYIVVGLGAHLKIQLCRIGMISILLCAMLEY